jgi:hypothetical protein
VFAKASCFFDMPFFALIERFVFSFDSALATNNFIASTLVFEGIAL